MDPSHRKGRRARPRIPVWAFSLYQAMLVRGRRHRVPPDVEARQAVSVMLFVRISFSRKIVGCIVRRLSAQRCGRAR